MASHGHKQELYVREIASILGVADFIYTSPPVRKGSATREASGDGLILVGKRGAVIQVKARNPASSSTDSTERTQSWIQKHSKKAMKQGLGTKRELELRQARGDAITVCPARALDLEPNRQSHYLHQVSNDTRHWPVIVVIDHPKAHGIDLGFRDQVIWFTLEDWKELHLRLRSVSALLHYVERVLADELHVPLGHESERYAALRIADEKAVSNAASGLPFLAHPTSFDSLGTELFQDILEKVWPDDGIIPWRSADEYRSIVEFLDAVPPTVQASIGRWILKKRAELAQGQNIPSGIAVIGADRLVFSCSNSSSFPSSEDWLAEAFTLAMLRHTQAIESDAAATTNTLCVAVLVDDEKGRGVSYSFVLLQSSAALQPIPQDIRSNFEWRYGIHNHKLQTTEEQQFNRSDLCPCMSGREFGMCHGK